MTDVLSDEDLPIRPTQRKHSIGELLSHLALLPKADWLIASEATEETMAEFYRNNGLHTLEEIKSMLVSNVAWLEAEILHLTETEMQKTTTA